MARTWIVCLTIVAAFPPPLFAAEPAATVRAPLAVPALALARTLGLDPGRDRVRFLPDFVRLLHTGSEERAALIEQLRRDPDRTVADAPAIVVPLDAAVWSAAVFRRTVPLDQLVTAIVVDRRAALLAAGLAALDDDTLRYLTSVPALLGELYERGAAPVAAFGASLRVHDGRVVTPGDVADRAVWEAVVGVPADAPERFIRQLFAPPGGTSRLAYLYGTVAACDPPLQRFVLGRGGPQGQGGRDERARIDQLRALAAAVSSQYSEWKLDGFPFSRPLHDLGLLLARVRVGDDGQLAPPADRAFWTEVWSLPAAAGAGATAGATAGAAAGAVADADAAWLAQATGVGNTFVRGDRIDQVAFAQRVFGATTASARADAALAVRAFPRQRMLMLALERMGFRAPSLFAFASRQAALLAVHDGARNHWVMAQLQSALALLSRMVARGSLSTTRAEALVRSLFTVPLEDGRYAGGIARWFQQQLAPTLPPSTDDDTSVLLALAGPPGGPRTPVVEWEGERYRLDVAASELRRLQAVRARQGGPTLAAALSLERVARDLAAPSLDLTAASAAHRVLLDVATLHAQALQSSLTAADLGPAGIDVPRRPSDTVNRLAHELEQAIRAGDLRRASREATSLRDLVDVLMGQALLATAYAADLGDPDGPALLSRNAALRHDFGVGRVDVETRSRTLWAVPRQDFQPGVAWHVTGSALGLDIALARLSLRRINADRVAAAPRIASIDREGFAIGVALIDEHRLRDETADRVAAAWSRGTARVTAAVRDVTRLAQLADTVRMDALRRRSLQLAAAETPERVPELFSLVELLQLGDGPSLDELSAWGANALPLVGCACTSLVLPSRWPLLMGRAQLPLAPAAVPDLNLRVAILLSELRLPAQLLRPVLAAAVQDFLEDAAPVDGGDWWALSKAARAVTRARVEDYVAAAASVGGALVPEEGKEP